MYPTIISVAQLNSMSAPGADLCLFDCSFDLGAPEKGYAQFLEGHITGAQHADLDRHLSTHDAGLQVNGGRHPLPTRESFARWLGKMGVGDSTQVVVYDRNGMNYCGRLWWMLKWCGHEAVAVLDGGWAAWQAAGGAVEEGEGCEPVARTFTLRTPLVAWVDRETVFKSLGSGQTLIDARGAPRYRGEVEPLDPVAGHIPGALNRPFTANFTEEGFLKSPAALREEFDCLLGLSGQVDASQVVHHCGSGVSAVPNILAMQLAGYGLTKLYAGSWSEWCNTPGMPVAKGD